MKNPSTGIIRITVEGAPEGRLPVVSLMEGCVERVVNPSKDNTASFHGLPATKTFAVVIIGGVIAHREEVKIPSKGECNLVISIDGPPDDKYEGLDESALAWTLRYSEKGMKTEDGKGGRGVEFGSSLYSTTCRDGRKLYSFNKAAVGENLGGGTARVKWNKDLPTGATLEGVIHNHTAGGTAPNEFSKNPGYSDVPADIETMDNIKKDFGRVNWYLAAPDGTLKVRRILKPRFEELDPERSPTLKIAEGLVTNEQVQREIYDGIPIPKPVQVEFTSNWEGKQQNPKRTSCTQAKVKCIPIRGHGRT